MSRRRALEKLCATPSKYRYGTEDDAVEGARRAVVTLRAMGRKVRPFHVYLCPCGWYHLTSHGHSMETGRFLRRVDA